MHASMKEIILDAVAAAFSARLGLPESPSIARSTRPLAPHRCSSPICTPLALQTRHPHALTARAQQLKRYHRQLCRPRHALLKAHIHQHVVPLRSVQLALLIVRRA